MKMFRQIGAVTAMNFRSLPHRVSTSLVVVIGIAGVVAVLVSVLAMSTGLIRTMENTGRDDRAIVLRNGSIAETSSALDRNSAKLIVDGAGIKRDADGSPITSAETMTSLSACWASILASRCPLPFGRRNAPFTETASGGRT